MTLLSPYYKSIPYYGLLVEKEKVNLKEKTLPRHMPSGEKISRVNTKLLVVVQDLDDIRVNN